MKTKEFISIFVGCARFERAKVPKYRLIYHEVHLSYLTCAIFFGNTQIELKRQATLLRRFLRTAPFTMGSICLGFASVSLVRFKYKLLFLTMQIYTKKRRKRNFPLYFNSL